ncbi:hypothetical protein AAG570_004882 [Ranatra chinensis]|uniref:Copper homeostasis protein cutC homolog n=1 Tax=Ranatra chinensis TaxID=642074 RepID=A0ABD0XZ56_9HEMI
MEVCVDSVHSAINAVEGGASRLEVCSALVSEGGLTPSLGLFKAVKEVASKAGIPVFAMVRVRGGNDFCYTPEEVKVMEDDAASLKEVGADGLVFGALTGSGEVDREVCARVLKVAAELPTTFHRAFDHLVGDPLKALDELVDLGFSRLLTSGGPGGFRAVGRLVGAAGGRIAVMPGGGITGDNLDAVLRTTGAVEFHGSAKVPVQSGSRVVQSWIYRTDKKTVEDMVATYRRYMASRPT